MSTALWMLLRTVGGLLAGACLLRAWAQWVQVHPRNPLMQFLFAVTDWLVKPLRRVVPGFRGIDWASVVAGYLVALLLAGVFFAIFRPGGPMANAALMPLLALNWLVGWGLNAMLALLVVQVVLSWVNPNAPMAPAVEQLVRPVLAPLRRFIPLVGGVDLSPMAAFLIIQFALMALESVF